MKCELAQEYVALSVYGELSDDQAHQLEQHLADCAHCHHELEAMRALQKAMSQGPAFGWKKHWTRCRTAAGCCGHHRAFSRD
jgi:hypothetical protein